MMTKVEPILSVQLPPNFKPERRYILSVLLNRFLGIDFKICTSENSKETVISFPGNSNKITIADALFGFTDDLWLTQESMPQTPFRNFTLPQELSNHMHSSEPIPVIYGEVLENGEYIKISNDGINFGIDLLGASFFLLTRYEEIVIQDVDKHSRFPSSSSILVQQGVITKPIVNIYTDVLKAAMITLWPQLEAVIKKRSYQVILSHDVDRPWIAYKRSIPEMIRSLGKDIILRKDLSLFVKRSLAFISGMTGNFYFDHDPANSFDFIMSNSERYNLKSTFNFVSISTAALDPSYSISHPWIIKLMKEIVRRGHLIGLHTSYDSYLDSNRTTDEYNRLREVTSYFYNQSILDVRQHYLRWKNPETWQNLENAGLVYDSSLTFADVAGFRCGVCYDFPVFNLKTRSKLKIIEKPLIIMENALFALPNSSRRIEMSTHLAEECRKYKGDFTFLCHNSSLQSRSEREEYKAILSAIS